MIIIIYYCAYWYEITFKKAQQHANFKRLRSTCISALPADALYQKPILVTKCLMFRKIRRLFFSKLTISKNSFSNSLGLIWAETFAKTISRRQWLVGNRPLERHLQFVAVDIFNFLQIVRKPKKAWYFATFTWNITPYMPGKWRKI